MNNTINATQARKEIYGLIEKVQTEHNPILITGKKNNAVLVSEEDWKAILETLYLSSIKGMRESILKGMKTDLSNCSDSLEW